MNILIIGNGVAGITAAKTIRQKSSEAVITVVTDEQFAYYNRPALIDFIAGRKKEDELYFYPESWYTQNNIKVLLEKSVQKLQLSAKSALLDDGSTISYDKLIIAAGASANTLPIPGSDSPKVLTLRCLEDAKTLMDEAGKTSQIAFIGGGVLGIEAAAAVKASFPAIDITVIEVAPYLLPRQLDAKGGEILSKCLAARGLKVIAGAKISAIGGDGAALDDGRKIPADLFVVSAGIKPNIKFAAEAGIAVAKGIIVNEYLETSAPDVFAAGDCAEYKGVVWGIVPVAVEQARIAASNAAFVGAKNLSPSQRYEGTVMSNTLKVAGIDLTTEGNIAEIDGIVTYEHADTAKEIYKKIFLKDGVIVGSMCMGDAEAAKKISAVRRSAKPVGEKEAKELIS
ncbi:MAG: NAD(P)/FAD-dependent oxidoreductase [Elusimicrobia bacterium HGW-Elusimicrobia-1]|jgi:nitrite reductase (NADH) large subunit|nr:MAG: NAD(P)/FAD-dependent oxidoreductase [Elusimicrobia bacterium HGW-Elusimicrobia-1]